MNTHVIYIKFIPKRYTSSEIFSFCRQSRMVTNTILITLLLGLNYYHLQQNFLSCPFWSFLGYAAHGFGAVMVLARQLWSSSKWLFGPSFLISYCGVFGGRGIVDVLKILKDLFRTSSFSFLEL